LQDSPEAGLIYTDEDKISENGARYFDPHFKPDWSPDLMTNVNYITHFVVIKKAIVDKVGALDPGKDGAQDYDFLLRVIDTGAKVVHVPKILYHWRAAERSTAQDFSSKPYITQNGKKSLEEHLARRHERAEVTVVPNRPGFYRVTYEPPKKVSIIIPPFANSAVLQEYVALLAERTASGSMKVTFVTSDDVHLDLKKENMAIKRVAAKTYDKKFLNQALAVADETVVVMNQALLPETSDWLMQMSGLAELKRVGAVAPVVVNNEQVIEDAGLVQYGNGLRALFAAERLGQPTYFGNTEWTRDVDALTGGCIVLKNSELQTFLKSSGRKSQRDLFTEFSLHQKQQGKQNVLWACVVLSNGGFWPSGVETGPSFNPSLFWRGKDIRTCTTEEQLLNYLISLRK